MNLPWFFNYPGIKGSISFQNIFLRWVSARFSYSEIPNNCRWRQAILHKFLQSGCYHFGGLSGKFHPGNPVPPMGPQQNRTDEMATLSSMGLAEMVSMASSLAAPSVTFTLPEISPGVNNPGWPLPRGHGETGDVISLRPGHRQQTFLRKPVLTPKLAS